MDFASIRMISDDLEPLVDFYEQVTGISAVWPGPFSWRCICRLARLPSVIRRRRSCSITRRARADNHSVIIEFAVDDVDQEFERLKTLVTEWVQEPTTTPREIARILFRDPDNNLVNLFTPVTEEAIERFSSSKGATRAVAR